MIEPTWRDAEGYGRIVGMRTVSMSRMLADGSAADRSRLVELVDRLVEVLQRRPFTIRDED